MYSLGIYELVQVNKADKSQPKEYPSGGFLLPTQVLLSIVFVSIGLLFFIWQFIHSGWMLYKARKWIHVVVFGQTLFGIAVTIVTLLTSFTDTTCDFRLMFSIIGVNIGNICLQIVLLWKAYIGNNRSKIVLVVGILPLCGMIIFVWFNFSYGRSTSYHGDGVCIVNYSIYLIWSKTIIDCISNAVLSMWFVFVIYRHYKLFETMMGGNSPVLYTIDWYIVSYLIIKQLKCNTQNSGNVENDTQSIESHCLQEYQDSDKDIESESGHLSHLYCKDYREMTPCASPITQDIYEKSMFNVTLRNVCPPSPQSAEVFSPSTLSHASRSSLVNSTRKSQRLCAFVWDCDVQTEAKAEEEEEAKTQIDNKEHC
ncbi:hypothetical protein BDF14DRAFT_1730159 [Spinellus fusiger]|nr:hypothetical protein BDF14DRAFT_1730159 [Spinellus fusiger]